jgi:hypothetical protein
MITHPSETLSLSVRASAGAALDFRAEPAVRQAERQKFGGKGKGGVKRAR